MNSANEGTSTATNAKRTRQICRSSCGLQSVWGLRQIRKVQRRSWRERRWRCVGTAANAIAGPRTKLAETDGSIGKTAIGSTAGWMTRIPARTGGAKLTGASASLKAVSGRSTRGRANTQLAVPNSNRASIERNILNGSPPQLWIKIVPPMALVNEALVLQVFARWVPGSGCPISRAFFAREVGILIRGDRAYVTFFIKLSS